MATAKQVVVVRRDLAMPVGKISSQVAHASLGAVQALMQKGTYGYGIGDAIELYELKFSKADPLAQWWLQAETTIVLGTHPKRGDHVQQLRDLQEKAHSHGLPTKLVTDNGTTVFGGVPTVTCLGIGPGFLNDFVDLTDHLRPL